MFPVPGITNNIAHIFYTKLAIILVLNRLQANARSRIAELCTNLHITNQERSEDAMSHHCHFYLKTIVSNCMVRTTGNKIVRYKLIIQSWIQPMWFCRFFAHFAIFALFWPIFLKCPIPIAKMSIKQKHL